MTVGDLIDLFIEQSMQSIMVYDFVSKSYVYDGYMDNCPEELCELEILSIDCIERKYKNIHDFACISVNVEV